MWPSQAAILFSILQRYQSENYVMPQQTLRLITFHPIFSYTCKCCQKYIYKCSQTQEFHCIGKQEIVGDSSSVIKLVLQNLAILPFFNFANNCLPLTEG